MHNLKQYSTYNHKETFLLCHYTCNHSTLDVGTICYISVINLRIVLLMYGRFLLKQPVYQNGKDKNEIHVTYFSSKFVFTSRLDTVGTSHKSTSATPT